MALALQGGSDLMSVPLQLQFDPKILRLNNISNGDLMAQGGQQPVVARNIQNDAGVASIQLSRPPGASAASGDGVLVTLSFQAVGRGSTNITISNLSVSNAQGQVLPAGGPPLPVRVQ